MRITLIDDSIPFDGSTPRKRSIGGAEKAFVGLSEAFAAKGYEVTAVNRCESYFELNGVRWLPFDAPRPPDCEILIAFRRPTLLQEIDDVDQRFLWLWGPLSFLNKAKYQVLLDRYMPTLVYLGETQRRSWKPNRIYQEAIIVPGVVDAYLDFESDQSEPLPVAITTTHPRHAMQEILRLWVDEIRPNNDHAQLHIYSTSLSRWRDTGEIGDDFDDLIPMVLKSEKCGVFIKSPMPDSIMANVYGAAKLHLYPAIKMEMYGNTLAESQATGLPALVRTTDWSAGAIAERVCNGQSGYIAPDDPAFVNLVAEILAESSGIYRSLHKDALALQRQRRWRVVATEFETLWS